MMVCISTSSHIERWEGWQNFGRGFELDTTLYLPKLWSNYSKLKRKSCKIHGQPLSGIKLWDSSNLNVSQFPAVKNAHLRERIWVQNFVTLTVFVFCHIFSSSPCFLHPHLQHSVFRSHRFNSVSFLLSFCVTSLFLDISLFLLLSERSDTPVQDIDRKSDRAVHLPLTDYSIYSFFL